VTSNLLSPRLNARPETVRHCLASFGQTSDCTGSLSHVGPRSKCRKKNSACASSFVLKLVENVAETFEMLKAAFGDECLSRARTFEWFKRLKKAETLSLTIRAIRPTINK
jgi:hypothetical protein